MASHAAVEMDDYGRTSQSDSDSAQTEPFLRDGKNDNDIDREQGRCRRCTLRRRRSWVARKTKALVTYALPLVLILLVMNLFLSIRLYQRKNETASSSDYFDITSQDCARYTSTYTPALEAIEYVAMDFDYPTTEESLYRGSPTLEREASWEKLWMHEAVKIPTPAMKLLNRTNLDAYEKVHREFGEGYYAIPEMFHQLSCLSLIRSYTHHLHSDYPSDVPLPPFLSEHTPPERHAYVLSCIESLRLTLMCHGDMTPLLLTKDREPFSGFRADLRTHHVCRKWDRLVEWTERHAAEDREKYGHPHDHVDEEKEEEGR